MGMVTGKSHDGSPRVRYSEPWGSEYLTPGLPSKYQKGSGRVVSVYDPRSVPHGGMPMWDVDSIPRLFKERINAVKRLAVSTG